MTRDRFLGLIIGGITVALLAYSQPALLTAQAPAYAAPRTGAGPQGSGGARGPASCPCGNRERPPDTPPAAGPTRLRPGAGRAEDFPLSRAHCLREQSS
jgi:hypothetical protein